MYKINDFGEKIGGAKKDLWKGRSFNIEDLNTLTDSEALKFCTKDYVWPKPDYEELVKTKPVVLVYFIKKLRDSLPAKVKPANDENTNRFNREKYIEFVSIVRDILMNSTEEEELEVWFSSIFVANGYYEKSGYRGSWTKKSRENISIENKFVKAVQIRKSDIDKALVYIENTGFPDTENAWKKNINIKQLSDGYFVVKNSGHYFSILHEEPFETYEAAEEYLNGPVKEEMKNKKRNVVSLNKPELTRIVRNCPAYRTHNVTTDMMLETFKFRGGEFGNWASDEERHRHINYAYDALLDLSATLDIAPDFISLGKRLGIAFGSRGTGSALAHYEPAKVVINLTKIRGAGSLSHEWWHAFDHYVSVLCGNTIAVPFISEAFNRKSLISENISEKAAEKFEKLINTIKEAEASTEMVEKEAIKKQEKMKENLKSWLVSVERELKAEQKSFRKTRRIATEEELKEFNKIIDNMYNGLEEDVSNLNILYKNIKGRSIDKRSQQGIKGNLYWIVFYKKQQENAKEVHSIVDSNYYNEAKKIDKQRSKAYWATIAELTARAFESYIQDKINEKEYQSDYLVHHAINCFDIYKPYPEEEERIKINRAFDEFFKEFKKAMDIEPFNIN